MPSLTVNAHVLTHTSTHKHGHGVNLDRGGDGDAKENTWMRLLMPITKLRNTE